MERPMQKPQDNKVNNQPTKTAGAEVKREDRVEDRYQPKRSETELGNIRVEEKQEEKKEEAKSEERKEDEKKTEKKEQEKKEKAIVNGENLGISKKHSIAICDLIRGKNIEEMISELEQVTRLKKPLKMKGEIPHRHGNIMSGRYPVNASKVFIKLLKSLQANSQVNGIENPVIVRAIANDASRPFKRGGSMRFKRTNVYLEAREKIEKKEEAVVNKQEIKEKK